MITALDSNVLLDVFLSDPRFGPASAAAIQRCIGAGGLVACEVVWAEIAPRFQTSSEATKAMGTLGVAFDPQDVGSALSAGMAWRSYRRAGGRRERLLPDFLVGAHAAARADRLLTRDRGFYRTYFKRLRIIDPSEG